MAPVTKDHAQIIPSADPTSGRGGASAQPTGLMPGASLKTSGPSHGPPDKYSYRESPATKDQGPPKHKIIKNVSRQLPHRPFGRKGGPRLAAWPRHCEKHMKEPKIQTPSKSTIPMQSSTGAPQGAGGRQYDSSRHKGQKVSCLTPRPTADTEPTEAAACGQK